MFKLREVTVSDLEEIRTINEAAIPAVNTVSIDEFLWFFKRSLYFKVSVNEKEQVCGFLLVLPTGLDYESLNYKWFSKNFSAFAYIAKHKHILGSSPCGFCYWVLINKIIC